eukprot:TRINITY_DN3236_c0_g1_i1.p1 TRINITY_DN3236_c0_g1~~TRINITY_DN3236_c0_g1_i1.p1  ORF type:complete len:89 (+),score=36.41 TRINITY_DN3236_c0_g1_i1:45-311(+)
MGEDEPVGKQPRRPKNSDPRQPDSPVASDEELLEERPRKKPVPKKANNQDSQVHNSSDDEPLGREPKKKEKSTELRGRSSETAKAHRG